MIKVGITNYCWFENCLKWLYGSHLSWLDSVIQSLGNHTRQWNRSKCERNVVIQGETSLLKMSIICCKAAINHLLVIDSAGANGLRGYIMQQRAFLRVVLGCWTRRDKIQTFDVCNGYFHHHENWPCANSWWREIIFHLLFILLLTFKLNLFRVCMKDDELLTIWFMVFISVSVLWNCFFQVFNDEWLTRICKHGKRNPYVSIQGQL